MINNDIEELREEATQSSMVDGGKISVFGSDGNNKFNHQDWYEQLFELDDADSEEDILVESDLKVENFDDKRYFSGSAAGISSNLKEFISYIKTTDEYKKYGYEQLDDYKAICNTLDKYFDGPESVIVKQHNDGWKVIFDVNK